MLINTFLSWLVVPINWIYDQNWLFLEKFAKEKTVRISFYKDKVARYNKCNPLIQHSERIRVDLDNWNNSNLVELIEHDKDAFDYVYKLMNNTNELPLDTDMLIDIISLIDFLMLDENDIYKAIALKIYRDIIREKIFFTDEQIEMLQPYNILLEKLFCECFKIKNKSLDMKIDNKRVCLYKKYDDWLDVDHMTLITYDSNNFPIKYFDKYKDKNINLSIIMWFRKVLELSELLHIERLAHHSIANFVLFDEKTIKNNGNRYLNILTEIQTRNLVYSLKVTDCILTKSEYDVICSMINLKKLTFSGIKFQNDDLKKLCNLEILTELNILYTEISSLDLYYMLKHSALKHLFFNKCKFNSMELSDEFNVTKMKKISFKAIECKFDSDFFKIFENRTDISKIMLLKCDISDCTVSYIFRLEKLTSLIFSKSNISPDKLNFDINLPELTYLDISGTKLTPHIVEQFKQINTLVELRMNNCDLETDFIKGFIELPLLNLLSIKGNQKVDSIKIRVHFAPKNIRIIASDQLNSFYI